nr:hypothetical protein CFP56_09808 [Quercus suber]
MPCYNLTIVTRVLDRASINEKVRADVTRDATTGRLSSTRLLTTVVVTTDRFTQIPAFERQQKPTTKSVSRFEDLGKDPSKLLQILNLMIRNRGLRTSGLRLY